MLRNSCFLIELITVILLVTFTSTGADSQKEHVNVSGNRNALQSAIPNTPTTAADSQKGWSDASVIVSLFSLSVAIATVIITLWKFSIERAASQKTNEALYWLSLRTLLNQYNDIHFKLRGGKWKPITNDEWAKVEAYMGIFEHCYPILKKGLVSPEIFRDIYEYRIKNILKNEEIVYHKLNSEEGLKYWRNFINLVNEFVGSSLIDESIESAKKYIEDTEKSVKLREPSITVSCSVDNEKVNHWEDQTITITVKDKESKAISGAIVEGEITNLLMIKKFETGITDDNGEVSYRCKINEDFTVGEGYTVSAKAIINGSHPYRAKNTTFRVVSNTQLQ
jgi:hypothetical protein